MRRLNRKRQHPYALSAEATYSADRQLYADTPSRCDAERVSLLAADGYPLTAIHYAADGPVRANLVVAGATGVPQGFYRRFARFAAAHGYATLTLDYRGVGLSAPATLKGFRMDYFDWGRLDLAAAVDAMSRADLPLYVVGHSYGGHAFGMLPNHGKVAAFVTYGTGAGWHGWMPPLERIKVLALWHVIGPLLTRWKGYLPWSLLGMGEDLPLDFYRQWKRWCRYPDYFFSDPYLRHRLRGFSRVRAPILAATSLDDRWSPPKSRDAFMAGYTHAAWETLDIDPAQLGLRALGHMGYFRFEAQPLWLSALHWLDRRARDTAVGRNTLAPAKQPLAAGRASKPTKSAALTPVEPRAEVAVNSCSSTALLCEPGMRRAGHPSAQGRCIVSI